MTLSVWRFAHLALAILSSLFLLILSVTGVILAVGAVNEKTQGYKVEDFNTINLSQVIPELWKVYPEITELTVDHNQHVIIDAADEDGNPVKSYINPLTGAVLGEVKPLSDFIQWNIALHRSLFLKETGRIIVGIVSFCLFLITISGTVLIVKRQQGVKNFFAKINRDFFSQYFHVVSGRLFLIPVLILALTGTYLFMVRIGLAEYEITKEEFETTEAAALDLNKFPVFTETKLADVEKIEFPFMPDDEEEFYILKLKDREVAVNQVTGALVYESKYPKTLLLEKLSLNLHTGKTNAIWAIILGFASLNILAFIYTGFDITLRRKGTKIKNKFTASNAEYVILVGTENGSTLSYANHVHNQLLAVGKRSFLTEMNKFTNFPEAKHLLIFSSTYGLGTAPANATNFETLVLNFSPEQKVSFSVLGFGSKAYEDFCAYAKQVDSFLESQKWASRALDLYTVNDRSLEDLVSWAKAWNSKSNCELSVTPATYTTKVMGLKKFTVTEKTYVTAENSTFKVSLEPNSKQKFQSGDLLAIYPANDGRERLYSVGRANGKLELVVKLHQNGLGSEFLHNLKTGTEISARIVENKSFHFPTKATCVVMIANGTGIAPFLGMIQENKSKKPVRLYAGFRHNNELSKSYAKFGEAQIAAGNLAAIELAFSREENAQYVMDLIRKDASFFADILENNGAVMICGSLAMQRDVEKILAEVCSKQDLSHCRDRIFTDCY